MTISSKLQHRVSLKQLRYFCAVAEHKHFGLAAKSLNISNSPLSANIKDLEEQIGAELFKRTTRSVLLTSVGQLLYEECQHIFSVLDGSISRVIKSARVEQETLNIGLVSSFFWAGLGPALRSFKNDFPEYAFSIYEMTPEEQKLSLDLGTIDVGLSRFGDVMNIAPLVSEQLKEDNMLVVISNQHQFRDRKVLSLGEIANERFVCLQRQDSASTKLVVDTFLVHGYHMNIVQEVFEPNTLMSIVATSDNIALVPSSFASQKWPDVHFAKLREIIPAHLCAVYKAKHDNPVLNAFLPHMKQQLKN